MYCSIRDYKDYEFIVNTSSIKEYVYSYKGMDMSQKLEISRDESNYYVFSFDFGYKPNPEELKEMRDLSKVRPNVKFQIMARADIPKDIPFFYGFPFAANTLGEMKALCEIGVTDVYITGDLGFKMNDARLLADRNNVKIRVVPNIAQVSGFTYSHKLEGDNLTAFWIRPEDLNLYEGLIDVIEFQCLDDRQAVFYDIYFENRRWQGYLGEIIAGVENIDNRGLIAPFTESRINCGNICHMDKCHRCHRYARASELIVENNLKVEKES